MSLIPQALSEKLIASLKNDDPLAMEKIFNLHWEQVFDAAFRKLGDEDIACDITQEIFISLWQNRKNLILKGNLAGYLHGALKYKVVNYYRSNAIKDRHHAELSILMTQQQTGCKSDENIMLQDTRGEINAALAGLPERMRMVIFMSRIQEKSINEIATELNVSVQTVKNQITASMKILRKALFYTILLALFRH